MVYVWWDNGKDTPVRCFTVFSRRFEKRRTCDFHFNTLKFDEDHAKKISWAALGKTGLYGCLLLSSLPNSAATAFRVLPGSSW